MTKFLYSLSVCSVLALSSVSAAPLIDELCADLGVKRQEAADLMQQGHKDQDMGRGFKLTTVISDKDPHNFLGAFNAGRVGLVHFSKIDADVNGFTSLRLRAWDDKNNILPNVGDLVIRQGNAVDPAKGALFFHQDADGVIADDVAELLFLAPRFVITGTPLARTKTVFEGVKDAAAALQAFQQKRVLLTHVENNLTRDKVTKKSNGGTFAVEGRIADSNQFKKLTGRFRVEFKYAETLTGAALKVAFDNLKKEFVSLSAAKPIGWNLTLENKVMNFAADSDYHPESINFLFSDLLKDSSSHHLKVAVIMATAGARELTKDELGILGTTSRNTMLVAMRKNTPQLDKLLLEKPEGWDKTTQNILKASLQKAGFTRQAVTVAFENWLDAQPLHAVKIDLLSHIRDLRPLTPEETAKLAQASKGYMSARIKRLDPELILLESGKKAGWEKTALTKILNCSRAAGQTPEAVKILFDGWLGKTNYKAMKAALLESARTIRPLTENENKMLIEAKKG